MAVIGTAKTLALSCLIAVGELKKTVNLSADVVATVTFSEKEPLLKNLAESDDRKVETLFATVTLVDPVLSGSGEVKGEDGEFREVVALAEAFVKDKAYALLVPKEQATDSNTTIIPKDRAFFMYSQYVDNLEGLSSTIIILI
jgi:hypothetical protein